MSNSIKFVEPDYQLHVASTDKELTPILAKSKIIPIRSGIALKIEEKEKKLLVDEAARDSKGASNAND